jgi:hypothetical protein
MYSLQEKDIYRLISACRHYMSQTSSEYTYDEYSRILTKLENYLFQNFPDSPEGKNRDKD